MFNKVGEGVSARMTQYDKADLMGISQSFFSRLYNGMSIPSFNLAEKLRPITGWSYAMWQKATTAQRQRMLDKIGKEDGKGGRNGTSRN